MENDLQKFCQLPLNLDKLSLNMSADGQIMDSSSRTLEKLENENNKNGSVKQVLLDGCVPFSHQVAGHKCGINNTGQFFRCSSCDLPFFIETLCLHLQFLY